ncbi:MAG: COG1361 S-layer family protein, partial [Candidatus Kariarchaeaceae archaeon]
EEFLTIPAYLLGNVELEITASPESLSEGDNIVTFTISNVGSGKAISVNIDFTLPPNLPIIGDDNHWFFNSILPEEHVNVNLRFFVDTSIIGQSIEFQVSISYIDPYGSGKMINRFVGLKVDSPLSYQDVLTVSVDKNLLVVGVVNEPSIKIVNTGDSTINSLVATLSFPTAATGSSPLTILSSNEWRFDDLEPEVDVNFMSKILPALGSIDNSYQAQLSLSYRDEDGDIHMETKTIGFNVRGRAIFLLLNEQVSPDAFGPGDIFTISGDLINTGTTRALYTSFYADGSTIFSTFFGSEYIGEIDPNVPTPYSINVKVSEETEKGTSPLTIVFMYQDDYGEDFTFQKTFEIEIGESSNSNNGGTPEPPNSSNEIVQVLSQFLIPAIVIIAILITIVIFVRRRRRKEEDLI